MTLDQTRPQAETLNRGGRASQLEPDSAKRELAHCGGERRGSRLNMSELQGSGSSRGPAWGMVRVSLQGCPSSLPSLGGWGPIPHPSSASFSLLLLFWCITLVDINPINHFILLQS